MLRSCLLAVAFLTVGLLPVVGVVGVTTIACIPAYALMSRGRYGCGFVVGLIASAAVALTWGSFLAGLSHSELLNLPRGWSAAPAWIAAFVVAQTPFVGMVRAYTRALPAMGELKTAFGWAWVVSLGAFLTHALIPGLLRYWTWLPLVSGP